MPIRTRTWDKYRRRVRIEAISALKLLLSERSNVRADTLNTGRVATAKMVLGNTNVGGSIVGGGYLLPRLSTYIPAHDPTGTDVAEFTERSIAVRNRLVASYRTQNGGSAYTAFIYKPYPLPEVKATNPIESGPVMAHAVAAGRYVVYAYGGYLKVYDLEAGAVVYTGQRNIDATVRVSLSYSDAAGAGAALYRTGDVPRTLEVFTVSNGSLDTLFTADPRAPVAQTVYPPAVLSRPYGDADIPPTVLVTGYSEVDGDNRLLVFNAAGDLAASIKVTYAPPYANGPVMISDRLACTCAPANRGVSIVDIDAGVETCSVGLGESWITDAATDGKYIYMAVTDGNTSDIVKVDTSCNIIARLSQVDENPVLPPPTTSAAPLQSVWIVGRYILVGGDNGVALYNKDLNAVAKNTDRPLTNIQVW